MTDQEQLRPESIPERLWLKIGPRVRWEIVSLDQVLGSIFPCGTHYYDETETKPTYEFYAGATSEQAQEISQLGFEVPVSKPYNSGDGAVVLTKNVDGRKIALSLFFYDPFLRAFHEAIQFIKGQDRVPDSSKRAEIVNKLLKSAADERHNSVKRFGEPNSYQSNIPDFLKPVHQKKLEPYKEREDSKNAFASEMDRITKKALAATESQFGDADKRPGTRPRARHG